MIVLGERSRYSFTVKFSAKSFTFEVRMVVMYCNYSLFLSSFQSEMVHCLDATQQVRKKKKIIIRWSINSSVDFAKGYNQAAIRIFNLHYYKIIYIIN